MKYFIILEINCIIISLIFFPATTYLELWKRQQSVIIWEWDLQNVEEDEEPRPEFETSVKTFRINPVTREKEPYLPTWSRALRFFATGTTVLCMVSLFKICSSVIIFNFRYFFFADNRSFGSRSWNYHIQN